MENSEEKQIYLINDISEGYVQKRVSYRTTDPNICYIQYFKDVEIVSEIISDLDKAISGNFDLIDDPDVSVNNCIAFITPTEVEFYDDDIENIYTKNSALVEVYNFDLKWLKLSA